MSDDESRPSSKVARVIEEYGLEGRGSTLERRWIGDGDDRTSLRDLADVLNEAILEAALRQTDLSVTRPDVESTYRTLVGDDVSRADQLRKERELEQAGLDVEGLRSDFVTHQAIHTYLTAYRGAELPEQSTESAEREAESLQRLQGRTAAVAASTLDRVIERGDVSDRDYELFVEVQVVCEDCGATYDVGTLLREGGCDCGD